MRAEFVADLGEEADLGGWRHGFVTGRTVVDLEHHEEDEGDRDERDGHGQEGTESDLRIVDLEYERIVEIRLAERDGHEGHDHVLHECGHEAGEGRTHHESDGDGDQVALVDELAELVQEASDGVLLHARNGSPYLRFRNGDHSTKHYFEAVNEPHAPAGDGHDESVPELLLDKLDSLRVLRADTDEEKDALLFQIGGRGVVEREMVAQMSAVRPLQYPQRFEEAHRSMVRGIEVLDRNGARPAQMRRLGPLTPVAKWLVQQVTRWIVRSHLNRLIGRIGGLYERREANSAWGTAEHSMLRRSRLDIRRVQTGMSTKALGLPTFLLGGAVLTSIASGLRSVTSAALDSTAGVIVLGVILFAVLAALSWVALYSAGVARRRIKLSTDQPMHALWETIGAAGKPPRDESYNFAAYAIALLILSWIVVPLVVWLAIAA